MRCLSFVLWLLLFPFSTQATEHWEFSNKIAITDSSESVFHHLEGAGRKHIAVSAGSIAVIWEDNSSSDPQVYAAVKVNGQERFSPALQLSSGQEAYEPSITAITGGLFVAAWEQDSAVYALVMNKSGQTVSAPQKLSSAQASHVSVAALENQVVAVWREQQARKWSLKVARLHLNGSQLQILSSAPIEKKPLLTPVLFPSVSASAAGICVAWEDRRSGHTRLLYSYSNDEGVTFTAPEFLNEFQSNRNVYDKGSGVTRVSLNALGEDEVLAAWMDKRRSNIGYGIYASIGSDGGESFGPNEKVHGKKGDKQPHNNPSTAGNQHGDFVLAWDDFRSGDSDIWLAGYNDDGEWGKDFSPTVASGTAEQSHASIALDEQGGLHMVWIERFDTLSPTRLWYSRAIGH